MEWLDDMRNVLLIGNILVTGVITIVLWLRKPGEEAGRAVDGLRGDFGRQMADLKTKFAMLEERVKHMPDSEELAELEGTVKAIAAQSQAQSDRLQVMTAQLTRIENYLLHSKQ